MAVHNLRGYPSTVPSIQQPLLGRCVLRLPLPCWLLSKTTSWYRVFLSVPCQAAKTLKSLLFHASIIWSRHAVRVIRTALALSARQIHMIKHSFPRDSAPCTPSCSFENACQTFANLHSECKRRRASNPATQCTKEHCNGIFSFVFYFIVRCLLRLVLVVEP